jgi:hypothetical protein
VKSVPREEVSEQAITSSDSPKTKLRVLVKSSTLFIKNLTVLHGQIRDLHLDELRQHLEFLMMQLLYLLQMGLQQSKARWLQVAPILAKGVQSGWQLVKAGWVKISHMVEREFALEVEGGSVDLVWAEGARKMWKEQELRIRNQGKLIHSVRKLGKLGKGGLKEENIQREGQ